MTCAQPTMTKTKWEKIITPFKILKYASAMFWVWSLLIVSLANLGVIITFFCNWDQIGPYYSLLLNIKMGNLYTASIAMMAWGFYDFAKDYLKKNSHFRTYKTANFFTAFILSVFFAVFAAGSSIPLDQPSELFLKSVHWSKILFPMLCYIIAFIVSIYIYCVSWMEDERYIEKFSADDDDDYTGQADQRLDEIKNKAQTEGIIDGGVKI